MTELLQAARQLLRDWRSGELKLLGSALVLAVASVSAVGFFTDRIEQAMDRQANEVLAADLVIESGTAFDQNLVDMARQQGLSVAQTITFPSVVVKRDDTLLVQVKGVSAQYPLRGQLRTTQSPGGAETITPQPPEPGSAWVESRLLGALNVEPGDTLRLGQNRFTISAIVSHEPDRAANLFRLAPRIMLNLDDIASTGLLGPGSRVKHRLLFAGGSNAIEQVRKQLESELPRGARILDVRNARPELRVALERGSRFLNLTAITAILLCIVAVALSTRRFVERQADSSALLRCLGASRGQVVRMYSWRLLILGVGASALGLLIGFTAQFALAELIGHWFAEELPAPSIKPAIAGLLTGMLVLTGFSLPSVIRLGDVPPLRVFQRYLPTPNLHYKTFIVIAVCAVIALLWWHIGDDKLAARLIGGLFAAILLFAGISRLLVAALTPLRFRMKGSWRYGLASLSRNPATTTIQLTGFGLGITALLLLAMVRIDLINSWQRALPQDTPNQFLINIQPDEMQGVRQLLSERELKMSGPYPMVRARLIKVNDRIVSADDYEDDRAKRMANRDFNLSWSDHLPSDNKIDAGRFWNASETGEPWLSVEEGLARTLKLSLGDTLEFDVAGQQVNAKITSLRSVQWDSFNVNFFVVGTPGLLQDHPSTYIASFHLPYGEHDIIRDLVQRFPGITALDVSSLLNQVRNIMDHGSLAIEAVFLFTLLAGVLVLYAGIQASRALRVQEAAVLRTLGLGRRELLISTLLEFALLGALSGLIAAISASAIGYSLANAVFNLPWSFNPAIWIVAILGGAAGVGLAGILASWRLINKPPIVVLREL